MIIIIEKTPTSSSSNLLRKATSGMEKLSSLTSLQSKEKPISTSSIGVESSQVSIERDHFSNVIYKLTPE